VKSLSSKLNNTENELKVLVPSGVHCNVTMHTMTRWRVGGPVDFLIRPSTADQIVSTIQFLNASSIPWLVIGHTSNLLIGDEGIRGAVIQISDAMSQMNITETTVWGQAGIWVPGFSSKVGRSGLTGLEHTVGIPGTLGGLVCMNGGSMRKGIGDHLISCKCIDSNGQQFELNRDQCGFAYRESLIQKNGWIVTEACFELEFGQAAQIRSAMLRILRERRKKFPLKQPNCGSVFVSNPKMYETWGPPGAVIERCGFKGFTIGGAQVSMNHANFIVNTGTATANDILNVIFEIKQAAKSRLGCDLDCEVRYVTANAKVLPAHQMFNGNHDVF